MLFYLGWQQSLPPDNNNCDLRGYFYCGEQLFHKELNGLKQKNNKNNMKFLEQYLEERIKIKGLGDLGIIECSEGESVGVSLVIDGYDTGIEVWYADYASWLEEKIELNKVNI